MTSTAALIYLFDPLCIDCYGFTCLLDEISTIIYPHFNLGIIPAGRYCKIEGEIEETNLVGLKQACERIERKTGAQFCEAFFNRYQQQNEAMFLTELPGIVMHAISKYHPEIALSFACKMQLTLFAKGRCAKEKSTYKSIAKEFDLSFNSLWSTVKDEEMVYSYFERLSLINLAGLTLRPSLYIHYQGKYSLVADRTINKADLTRQIQSLYNRA